MISDARIGLADLCAVALKYHLDKPASLQVSQEWDNEQLSPEQLEYAALDALAALKIYEHLSKFSSPGVISDSALPGTPVSVYHEDGQIIAKGILSQCPPAAQFAGVNITKTRAQVTISEVIIPGAILALHDNKSLLSFGEPPFDIVHKRSTLMFCNDHTDLSGSTNQQNISNQPTNNRNTDVMDSDLIEFLNQSAQADADLDDINWTADVDDPPPLHHSADILENTKPDEESVGELQAFLEQTTDVASWPSEVRSRVLMDAWHAMARIKIPKEHGFR